MEESSAVFLLERILADAWLESATDVHVTEAAGQLWVQFRTNGELRPYLATASVAGALLRRIKALAAMDLTDRRRPQDGTFRWTGQDGECLDVRVSALPTVTGESIVLRLLPVGGVGQTLQDLGMTREQAETVEEMLQHRGGMLLVAGQTGSGKTTTLYAMMRFAATMGRSIVSIEDPVEMPLPFLSQLEVREQTGMTFERALRAALRQDPDILMVGEIRDRDTARTAMHAALSGHLVLSTTHATDPIGAAARLVEYGLPRALLGDVLFGLIIQTFRSSRCPACRGAGCGRCKRRVKREHRAMQFDVGRLSQSTRSLLASDIPWMEVRLRCQGVLPLSPELC